MIFKVQELTVDYGKARVLDHVSLNLDKREIVALIGPNGAGKTTLLRTASGLVPAVSGRILLNDTDVLGSPSFEMAKKGIVHCLEGGKVFPGLSVLENLRLGAYLRNDFGDDFEYIFSVFPILKRRQTQRAKDLSGGERIMLSIGTGLMVKPVVMLVDEPTLGLAPIVCMELGTNLKEISERRTCILLVEQNAQLAFNISNRCYVMEHGKIVIDGKTEDVEKNPHVRESYLGL